ncbi:peptidyl-prolyl cis-trans isomerase [Erythrobacter sp. HA6-11]
MPQWLKEPLVHFLIGGAILFGFFAWTGTPSDPASRDITIDSETLASISSGFEQQMSRAPTDAELDNLTERFIREEVLYREALRLGLDQDDAIVRRRLAQKMDLIAAAQAEAASPSDEELQVWLEAHPARFASDAKYTFEQLWFAEKQAADEAQINRDKPEMVRDNRASIELPATVSEMPRSEILDRFGQQFARELDAFRPSEEWQGPIPSGLGWHLVRLKAIEASELPPLSEIRDRVEADWRSGTATERKEAAYELLREAYTVEIDR